MRTVQKTNYGSAGFPAPLERTAASITFRSP